MAEAKATAQNQEGGRDLPEIAARDRPGAEDGAQQDDARAQADEAAVLFGGHVAEDHGAKGPAGGDGPGNIAGDQRRGVMPGLDEGGAIDGEADHRRLGGEDGQKAKARGGAQVGGGPGQQAVVGAGVGGQHGGHADDAADGERNGPLGRGDDPGRADQGDANHQQGQLQAGNPVSALIALAAGQHDQDRADEDDRLDHEQPERPAPEAGGGEQSAQHGAEQGRRAPDPGHRAVDARPKMLGEQGGDGDVAEGDYGARAQALDQPSDDEGDELGRQGAHGAADGVGQAGQSRGGAQAERHGQLARAGAGNDRARQIGGHRPAEIFVAADLLRDTGHDGGGHQGVGGVQPDAQAKQGEARRQRLVDLKSGASHGSAPPEGTRPPRPPSRGGNPTSEPAPSCFVGPG